MPFPSKGKTCPVCLASFKETKDTRQLQSSFVLNNRKVRRMATRERKTFRRAKLPREQSWQPIGRRYAKAQRKAGRLQCQGLCTHADGKSRLDPKTMFCVMTSTKGSHGKEKRRSERCYPVV
uniref:Uncharacterized protein n=1 Tax=Trichuris muris TaxID=70415 RepID=A0A5S6R2L8_TRIMR